MNWLARMFARHRNGHAERSIEVERQRSADVIAKADRALEEMRRLDQMRASFARADRRLRE